MIDMLKPIFSGSRAPYGEGLICCDAYSPPGTVSLAKLLKSSDILEALLRCQADGLGTSDLRPVASKWLLKYTAVLLPPVVAAATLLKHVFPMDACEVAVDLDSQGFVRTVVIPHLGNNDITRDTVDRYEPLIGKHLTPLINHLSKVSNLTTKILWGNVARRLEPILDQGAIMAAPNTELALQIKKDRDYLLHQRIWPQGCHNPLYGRRRTALQKNTDGRQTLVSLHRQCCLLYLLPETDYCTACPLSPRLRLSKSENCPSN